MTIAVPAVRPVSKPVTESIEAFKVQLHVPPGTASVISIVVDVHSIGPPDMEPACGSGSTVTL